jgi:hypothetical protein
VRHLLAAFVLCLALAGLLNAQQPVPGRLPPGAKLYIAPMEWNLDRFVAAEISSRGLPVQMVADPQQADFVMTSLYQNLGSRMMSGGHYIHVRIVPADGGEPVWRAQVRDFPLVFAQLRPHGRVMAARAIVKRLGNNLSGARR